MPIRSHTILSGSAAATSTTKSTVPRSHTSSTICEATSCTESSRRPSMRGVNPADTSLRIRAVAGILKNSAAAESVVAHRDSLGRTVDLWILGDLGDAFFPPSPNGSKWKYKARTIPSETLRRLEPVAPLLDPRPDEALLLTRSAVVNNESAAPWFRHVHSKAAETVAELDGGSSLSSIDGRLLGPCPGWTR
ncbi:hypothetical protein GQR58_029797 [Nymphon striatum]|nr:hypothetical protein GQR58_029797 [Nymphon striatum]